MEYTMNEKKCTGCGCIYTKKPGFSQKWFEGSKFCSRDCVAKKGRSPETREKMRVGHLGKKYKPMSDIGKNNLSIAHLGKKQSQETINKRRVNNAGFAHSQETKEKLSKLRMGEGNGMYGKIPHNWKGEEVGYYALHSWVSRKLGQPCECSNCGEKGLTGKKIHWANFSHKYLRDLNDWRRLCVKCHSAYDLNKITIQ